LSGRGLHPIDAHRFFVSGAILKANFNKVTGLQHLFGGLRKARFIPVEGRQSGEPRQKKA
jgi:hypothetical protein